MTRDITKSGGGAVLTEVPTLSPELRKILQRRKVVPNYGGDDGMPAGGADFRDGVWDAPEWVDARERDEAKQAQAAYAMQLRPVSAERIREFLLFLWNSTKHQNDTSWDAVAAVYPMMLDGHPSWCFRPERLKLAARHAFDWFPTVRQLVEFMEPDRQAILERVSSLKKVSEAPTSKPGGGGGGEFKWSVEKSEANARHNREVADRERKELIEIMRKRDAEAGLPPMDTSVPDQAPGESDKAYVSRLCDGIRTKLDAGTKAMRGRMRIKPKGADKPVPPPTPEAMKAAYDATGLKSEDVRESHPAEAGPGP